MAAAVVTEGSWSMWGCAERAARSDFTPGAAVQAPQFVEVPSALTRPSYSSWEVMICGRPQVPRTEARRSWASVSMIPPGARPANPVRTGKGEIRSLPQLDKRQRIRFVDVSGEEFDAASVGTS